MGWILFCTWTKSAMTRPPCFVLDCCHATSSSTTSISKMFGSDSGYGFLMKAQVVSESNLVEDKYVFSKASMHDFRVALSAVIGIKPIVTRRGPPPLEVQRYRDCIMETFVCTGTCVAERAFMLKEVCTGACELKSGAVGPW